MYVAPHRVVQYAPATLTWQPTDQNGELVAATGAATVTVTRADGSTVAAPVATVTAGVVSIPLTVEVLSSLDILTVTWLLDDVVRGSTKVDVVGPGGLTVAEVRAAEPTLSDLSTDTAAMVRAAIDVVEAMVESACNVAFTPRLSVARFRGAGSHRHRLPHVALRRVRWAYTQTDLIRTDAVTVDLDEVAPSAAGLLEGYWWWNGADVTVGYEHGWDAPPADLRQAMISAVRRRVNTPRSGLDSRAMSYTTPEGTNVMLATPGLSVWVTGIPEVDEVLMRYKHRDVKVG